MKNKDLLTLIKKTANQRSTVFILRKVLVTCSEEGVLNIQATDLNSYVSVSIPCECYPFEPFIAEMSLIDFMIGLKSIKIDKESPDSIIVNTARFSIDSHVDEFPTAMMTDHKGTGALYQISTDDLHSFVWYSSSDATRPVLCGVYLDKDRNNICSLDGHAARVRKNAGTHSLDNNILIPRDIIKILPKKERANIGNNVVLLDGATVIFNPNTDTYPNYPNVLPEDSAMRYKLVTKMSELKDMLPLVNPITKQAVWEKDKNTVTIRNDLSVYTMDSSHINENPWLVSLNLHLLIHILRDAETDTLLTQKPRDESSDCILGATIAKSEKYPDDTFLLMPLRMTGRGV